MRHIARETAFQIIYQIDLGGNSPEMAVDFVLEDKELNTDEATFCKQLVYGVRDHKEELDRIIQENTTGWTLERMMSVDRNLLRLATLEIVFCPDTPNVVAINEAVDLAKIFGDDGSSKFVNSILDKIAKTMEA